MKHHPEPMGLGGLTGQGFRNLLGRPRLVPVELLLREAVQNSWDARKRQKEGGIRFGIRIRNLERGEEQQFRKVFSQDDSFEPGPVNTLARQLASRGPIRVMELCDYGTIGLCGKCHPNEPTGGTPSRFGNFFFEIGRSHEDSGDGGTYGFGRSSLYIVGMAALVVVDTLAVEDDRTERRMMACRIGESFEVRSGVHRGRYTGRHFWGRNPDGVPQPVRGREAAELAAGLGMPAREGAGRTGTTIMIPWPVQEVDNTVGIGQALLHSLWPKMVPIDGRRPIVFELEVDGKRQELLEPDAHPEYSLFVRALEAARRRKEGPLARPISTLRPQRVTGHLGMAITASDVIPSALPAMASDDEAPTLDERPINSVALMRPTELVVRYMRIPGVDQAGRAWAGVFICDDATEVRTAFALAEPPAHDDWIADRLSDKTQKYLVRKTLQSQLPEAVRDLLGIVPPGRVTEAGSKLSLGSAAERFSRMFLAGDGQGPGILLGGESRGGNGPRGGGTSRIARLSPPVPVGIELAGTTRIARFRAAVSGPVGHEVQVCARPAIHAEGKLDGPPVGLQPPVVYGWEGGRTAGGYCVVELTGRRQEIDVLVALAGEYAVTVEMLIVTETV